MRRIRLTTALLVAAAIQIVALAGNALATFLTDQLGGVLRWVLPALVTVLIAVVQALIQFLTTDDSTPEPAPVLAREPGRPPTAQPPSRSRRSRGLAAPAAFLVVVLVIGGGGIAVAAGVRYAVGYVTGKETGTPRLAGPQMARAAGLSLRIEDVEHTAHFTRVELVGQNRGSATVTLPLFGNCVLSDDEGATLEADPFRSDWADSLAPGTRRRGIIIFPGHLTAASTTASFSCATVFGPGGGGSITVTGLRLRPVEE